MTVIAVICTYMDPTDPVVLAEKEARMRRFFYKSLNLFKILFKMGREGKIEKKNSTH